MTPVFCEIRIVRLALLIKILLKVSDVYIYIVYIYIYNIIYILHIIYIIYYGHISYRLLIVCQTPQPIHHDLSLTARCGYLHLLSTAAIAASLQRGLVCVARDGSCLAPQRINGSESRDVPFETLYPVYNII